MSDHIIHINTSYSWGGLEQYTAQYIRERQRCGVENTAVVSAGTRLEANLRDAGIDVVPARRNVHVSPADVRIVRRYLKQHRNAIVHSHTRIDVWTGSLATVGMDAPHVNTLYMIAVDKHDPLHRFIYGHVDAIVSTSSVNNDAIRRGFPIPAERIRLIRYMRDPETFRRDEDVRSRLRQSWGVPDDVIVIGLASRIDPQKGVREFVEALSSLPVDVLERTLFVIVGEPTVERIDDEGRPIHEAASAELYAWLTDQAQGAYGRHLRIMPFQKNLAGVLSAFDVFVLASYGEMYALSVIEAMMCGLPVIGTDGGGTPEQLSDGRGLAIESRSPRAIADAVTNYVRNPELRQEHARRGRAWAIAEHAPDAVMERWLSLYHSLL